MIRFVALSDYDIAVSLSKVIQVSVRKQLGNRQKRAALALVIREHFRDLFLVIACNAVRQDGDAVAGFAHIEAGGFHAGGGVGSCYAEVGYSVLFDIVGKLLAGQRVALAFCKNVLRHDFHFRNKLGATAIRLEGSRADRQIVVLDINHRDFMPHRPINGTVDIVDNLLVVFRDVVLDINND